uniref:Uncharacterized protein n=1 Tax=uncultured prokaryote TaxID=198431 RepID=A0A0H5Q4T0_9ZZZZ|nr:hypothetical protein [uncultured prokaryote]
MACPSIGIAYAPPLDLLALQQLLFPESWAPVGQG